MNRFFLHIGHHKTGTTFLQKKIFPHLPFHFYDINPEAAKYIFFTEKFEKSTFLNIANINFSEGNDVIISSEAFTGRTEGGEGWDNETAAHRLKEMFPDAKVMIMIRNQLDYILSAYTYRVTVRGFEHRDFDEYLDFMFEQRLREKLEYDKLIKKYIELFGSSMVLIMPYELLRFNNVDFVDKILSFLEVKKRFSLDGQRVNQSFGNPGVISINRSLNSLFKPILKNSSSGTKMKYYALKVRLINPILNKVLPKNSRIQYQEHWEKKLIEIFSRSNQELQKLIEFDLKELGYPI